MRLFQNLDWDDWLYGMWVAIGTGASSSVLSGLFVNAVVPGSQNKFWTLLGGFFVLGAVKDFFLYINKNPAPKRIPVKVTDSIETDGVKTKHVIETTVPEPAPDPPTKKD